MAADNNNLSSVASETDAATDAHTSELEVLSMDLMPTEDELEMDAKTFSLELQESTESGEIGTLQSDLRSKDERISNLQFDIEQLRSRWTGLEKEIAAREELTEMLQADLNSANQVLADKDALLQGAEGELQNLTHELEKALERIQTAEARTADLETETSRLEKEAAGNAATIDDLRERLKEAEDALPPPDDNRDELIAEGQLAIAELNAYVDGRKADWERQTIEVERLTEELANRNELIDQRDDELATAKKAIDDAQTKNRRLSDELDSATATVREQRKEVRSLQKEFAEISEKALPAAEKTIEQQQGRIADDRQKIVELETRASRADQYADELRDKLTSSFDKHHALADDNQRLEQTITELEASTSEAQRLLDSERERSTALTAANQAQKAELDEEIGQLRRELCEKREKLTDQAAINEKLTADLNENKTFKKMLEDQLTSYEEAHAEELGELKSSVTSLEDALEEAKRKIESKDKAVAALLSELAAKSKTIESIDEIESAIHDIDNRMSKRIDDGSNADRDRPTRLLIGNIDGQKLRFPLFKDRLTIGRTVQNDIQIRAHYISRRHAVVVTDDNGTKVVDWGSKNGVFVNKHRVSEKQLKNGDTVTIGTAEFRYEERARR